MHPLSLRRVHPSPFRIEAILDARRRLWDEARVAAEAGGATALAALTSGAYRPAR